MDDKYYKSTEKLLYNISTVRRRIENLTDDLNYYVTDLEEYKNELQDLGLDASGINRISTNTNDINDLVLKKVMRIEYLENEIPKLESKISINKKEIEKEEREINKLLNAINELDNRESLVVTEYYIKGESVSRIANKINITDSAVFKTKKQAVKKIRIEIFGFAALKKDYVV